MNKRATFISFLGLKKQTLSLKNSEGLIGVSLVKRGDMRQGPQAKFGALSVGSKNVAFTVVGLVHLFDMPRICRSTKNNFWIMKFALFCFFSLWYVGGTERHQWA